MVTKISIEEQKESDIEALNQRNEDNLKNELLIILSEELQKELTSEVYPERLDFLFETINTQGSFKKWKKKISIDYKDFKKNYNSKEPQLIILKFSSDFVDPVNSFMKISDDMENSFLFESLKDGDLSGRYSVIGIKPDKILKITNKTSKIYIDNNNVEEIINDNPIEAIRYFINSSLIKKNDDIPSIASGIFGFIGYDFVANIEDLPKEKIDEFDVPDSILLRPSITVVFDKELKEILICKAVWYVDGVDADNAYNFALDEIEIRTTTSFYIPICYIKLYRGCIICCCYLIYT